LCEEVQVLSVFGMVADGSVSSDKFHISDLTLARVKKDAIVRPAIRVAVFLPGLAGEQEDQVMTRRGADPALFLPAKLGVQITATVNLP
jgi:hypothetical protein